MITCTMETAYACISTSFCSCEKPLRMSENRTSIHPQHKRGIVRSPKHLQSHRVSSCGRTKVAISDAFVSNSTTRAPIALSEQLVQTGCICTCNGNTFVRVCFKDVRTGSEGVRRLLCHRVCLCSSLLARARDSSSAGHVAEEAGARLTPNA